MLTFDPPDYTVTLKPASIIIPPTDWWLQKQLVGGAGDQTLSDGLDSTYLRLTWIASGSSASDWVWPIVIFETAVVPNDVIFYRAQATARVRRYATRDHSLSFTLAKDYYPDEAYTGWYTSAGDACADFDPYYGDLDTGGWRLLSDQWSDWTIVWWDGTPDEYNDDMPTYQDVADGGIQMHLSPYGVSSDYAGDIMDVSNVTLTFEGTRSCTDNPSCRFTNINFS